MYAETGIHVSKSEVQQIILPIDSTESLGSRRAVDPAYDNVPYLTNIAYSPDRYYRSLQMGLKVVGSIRLGPVLGQESAVTH